MKMLSKIAYFLKAEALCSACLSNKSSMRLTDVWLFMSRRNYQLPVALLEGEMKLKKKDSVPLDSEVIYRMPNSKQLSILAIVCNVKLIVVPTLIGSIYAERNGKYLLHSNRMLDFLSEGVMLLTETQCYILGSAVIILCITLNRYICWRPLRIYMEKNTNKFTAIYMNSLLPWRNYKYDFTIAKPSFFSVKLGRKRALLEDDYFKTAAHQSKLYRYLEDNQRI